MKNPKVSIIIPVYNGSNYLGQAIESAFSQTYKNKEIIVINDGSQDGGATEKIAKSFGKKIRYYKKKNGGVASALNMGIQKMTGKYFSWLSHDDIYLPNKIETQINFLKNKPLNTIVYSDFAFINEQGKIRSITKIPQDYTQKFIYYLIKIRFMHGCTLLIPKDAFKKAGNFNIKFKNAQDYDLWFRMAKKGFIFRHLGKVLIKGRIHQGQGTAKSAQRQIEEENILYTKVLKEFSPQEIFRTTKNLAKNYFGLGLNFKKKGALEAANFAFNLGNSHLRNLADRIFYWYCRWRPKMF